MLPQEEQSPWGKAEPTLPEGSCIHEGEGAGQAGLHMGLSASVYQPDTSLPRGSKSGDTERFRTRVRNSSPHGSQGQKGAPFNVTSYTLQVLNCFVFLENYFSFYPVLTLWLILLFDFKNLFCVTLKKLHSNFKKLVYGWFVFIQPFTSNLCHCILVVSFANSVQLKFWWWR